MIFQSKTKHLLLLLLLLSSCVNEIEEQDDLKTVLFEEIPEISAPYNLQFVEENYDDYLTWDGDPETVYYSIYYSESKTFGYELYIDKITENFIELKGLKENTTYYLYIIAFGKFKQESERSEIVEIWLF